MSTIKESLKSIVDGGSTDRETAEEILARISGGELMSGVWDEEAQRWAVAYCRLVIECDGEAVK